MKGSERGWGQGVPASGEPYDADMAAAIAAALLRVKEVTDPRMGKMVESAVYRSGRVTVDRRLVGRGLVPCPFCGAPAGMGEITVYHDDGRSARFNPRLFHYAEAGHPINGDDVDGPTFVAIMADS